MTTRKKKSSMQDYLAKNAEAFVSSEAVDGSESPIQLPKPKKNPPETKESTFTGFSMDISNECDFDEGIELVTPTPKPTQGRKLDVPISTSNTDLQNPAKSILEEIEVEKTSESKYMTLYLKKDTINKLKKEAKKKNISASKLVNIILDKVLDA